MAQAEDQYLLIDDTGAERGLIPTSKILEMCQQRLIASKAQLCKKGLLSSYRAITEFPQFAQVVASTTVEFDRQKEAKRLHEAEHNPPGDAEMFLRVNEEQRGPYTVQQIRTMWANGGIPSNTLFYYEVLGDWKPAKSFCQGPDTIRWDYCREIVDIGYWFSDTKTSDSENVLHKRGSAGWELVSVCPITDTKFASATKTNELVFFFKRQVR